MEKKLYDNCVEILKEELIAAMGCTEPIAIAFVSALARKTLGSEPVSCEVLSGSARHCRGGRSGNCGW